VSVVHAEIEAVAWYTSLSDVITYRKVCVMRR